MRVPSTLRPARRRKDDAQPGPEASPTPPSEKRRWPRGDGRGPGKVLLIVFVVALASLLVLDLASAPRTVSIRYRFPTGRVLHYRWTVDASTTNESAGGVSQRLHMVLEVRERVLKARPDGGAHLRVHLRPLRKIEDGVPRGARPPIVLEIEVGPTGRVERILRAADLPPERISLLELDRLLSESRPPLPPGRVGSAAAWPAPLASKGERTSIDLQGAGRLLGFALDGGRRLAQVQIDRRGPVRAEQPAGGSRIQLEGVSETRSTADVDIDRGMVVMAVSRAVSRFKLSLEGQPNAGELRVVLRSKLELLETSGVEAAGPRPRFHADRSQPG